MTSTVNRSQFNSEPLRCSGTGDSHHECVADKSAKLSINTDHKLKEMFLVESMTQRIKTFVRPKVNPTQYYQCVPYKVSDECIVLIFGEK